MKETVHACLESMLYEALTTLNEAESAYKVAQRKFLYEHAPADNMIETEKVYREALQRYSDLFTAKRVIKEMVDKGIEI